MKSQTGQLARRATHAVMPLSGATATGGRKTSFRGSTTFVPYKHEEEDSDSSDADDNSGDEQADSPQARTVKPGFNQQGTEHYVICDALYLVHLMHLMENILPSLGRILI
jgi:hypothetical protein